MDPIPEKDIGWKIKRLHSAYAQFRDQNICDLDLTPSQAFLLGYLIRHRDTPVYASDIGRDFGLRHPTVSGLLSRMEQKDFIRYDADEDHRKKRIVLTERALAAHERIVENIRQTNEIASASLTEEERKQLHCLLDRVYDNLHTAIRTMGNDPDDTYCAKKALAEGCCETPLAAEAKIEK